MGVSVEDMLAARDRRAALQQELLEQYQNVLICFTMCIAGPVKTNDRILAGFRQGEKLTEAKLSDAGVKVLRKEEILEETGNEAFYVTDQQSAALVKQIVTPIEEESPLGRLFDIDVLGADGIKIDRTEVGLSPRRCLICDNPATVCARSRAHSVRELWDKTMRILEENEKL